MNSRVFSAYNLARGVLLNSRLSLADSGNQPLKLLEIVVSGMGMDPTTGLWLTPLRAVPAVPRVFPFDLIYLDKEYRVVEAAEMGPGLEFPPFQPEVSSALVLPSDVIRNTGTLVGDSLIVCLATELQALIAPVETNPAKAGIPGSSARPVATRPNGEGSRSAIIELTPETSVPLPRNNSGFESRIRTAAARADNQAQEDASSVPGERLPAIAEVVSSDQDSASSFGSRSSGSYPSEPSTDIPEAVLERTRQVPASIVEHRIDPEDLFSNWVMTAPPPPASRVKLESTPTEVPASLPDLTIRNGKQSAAKPAGPERTVEKADRDHSKAADVAESAASQPKSKTAIARSEKPNSKSKQTPDKAAPSVPSRVATPAPQNAPATTFTAAPYGMWQISMPTAVTSTSALSKALPSIQTGQSPRGGAEKIESSPTLSLPDTPKISPSVSNVKTEPAESSQARDPKSKIVKEELPRATADMGAKKYETAPKSLAIAPDAVLKHTPGDFVASLQEKLQRVQHSKPELSPPSQTQPRPEIEAPMISPAREPLNGVSELVSPPLTHDQAVRSKFFSKSEPELSSTSEKSVPALRSAPDSQPRPEKAKAESSASSLRTRFKHWFNPSSTPSDRRRAGRRYVPGMVAHYFTGGAPKPHEVADISMSGMYVLTDDRWMPGTMIQMTLQKPCSRGERKQSMNVLSRIVRRGSDGVAAEFVMSEALSHISHDIQPSQATDKFALARFL